MKIVIGTGGSGGHLFPALKVADELKKQGHEIFFVGSFRAEALEQIEKSGFPFENLNLQGFSSSQISRFFSSLKLMIKAYGHSQRFFKKIQPHVVVGFGGYGAFSIVVAAVFLKIPTLIHEQNVIPGRANALLAKGVNRIAISFLETQRYFPKRKVVLTGCPCNVSKKRLDKVDLLKEFHLESNRVTLLVLGGSQGSHHINDVLPQAIEILKTKRRCQVIHVTGSKDYPELKIRYQELGIPFALFKFLDKMEEAYRLADLVIARAGAVTVTEIAMAQVPAIFIPYPFAGGHQWHNAHILSEAKVAAIIDDKDLSASRLVEEIFAMIDSPTDFQKLFKNIENLCFEDMAGRLTHEIVRLGHIPH